LLLAMGVFLLYLYLALFFSLFHWLRFKSARIYPNVA
jgi:hypothetical protein